MCEDIEYINGEYLETGITCNYQLIRSGEIKCRADDKDIHVCLGYTEKYKCPIYRLKVENEKLKTELLFLKNDMQITKILCE